MERKALFVERARAFCREALVKVIKSDRACAHPHSAETRLLLDRLVPSCHPPLSEVCVRITRAVQRCDLAFRAGECTDERVTKWAYLRDEARGGHSLSGSQRGNADARATALLAAYARALHAQAVLIHIVQERKLLLVRESGNSPEAPPVYAPSVEWAARMIKDGLRCKEDRGGFFLWMIRTQASIDGATTALARFEAGVAARVNAKSVGESRLIALGSDLLLLILQSCRFETVATATRTCRAMRQLAGVDDMLPKISLRWWPHAASSTGEAIVYKNRVTPVAIDLSVQSRRHAMRTNAHAARTIFGYDTHISGSRADKRRAVLDVLRCQERNFVDSLPAEGVSCARLDALQFFRTQPWCSVELVYADTHAPVVAHKSPLVETHRARRHTDRQRMYTSGDGVPYPSWTDVMVNVLSSEVKNHAFKFRATVTAPVAGRQSAGHIQKLYAYSPPFLVLSSPRASNKRLRRE